MFSALEIHLHNVTEKTFYILFLFFWKPRKLFSLHKFNSFHIVVVDKEYWRKLSNEVGMFLIIDVVGGAKHCVTSDFLHMK